MIFTGQATIMMPHSGVLAATLLLTLLPAVGAGGGHTDASLCVSDRVDEVTDACCATTCSGPPQLCSPGCAAVFPQFYLNCQPLLEEVLAQSLDADHEQYATLNTRCVDVLATSPVAVACEDAPSRGRRGCGAATMVGPRGHESHCAWAHLIDACPATCSPRCSAPSQALAVSISSLLYLAGHDTAAHAYEQA